MLIQQQICLFEEYEKYQQSGKTDDETDWKYLEAIRQSYAACERISIPSSAGGDSEVKAEPFDLH